MHTMMTRSKAKQSQTDPPCENVFYDASDQPSDSAESCESLDSNENLKDLIDDTEQNTKETAEALMKLKTVLPERKLISKKKKQKQKQTNKGKPSMNDMLMSLLVLRATEKANMELRKKQKHKQKKQKQKHTKKKSMVTIQQNDIPNTSDVDADDEESDIELTDSEPVTITIRNANFENESPGEEYQTESSEEELEMDEQTTTDPDMNASEAEGETESENSEESDDSHDETLFEYDKLDEEYEEMLEKHLGANSEEADMHYYHHLNHDKKKELLQKTNDIYEFTSNHVPLRFKVIESDMDMKTKSIALENIDKLREMDVSTGEHSKMDHWVQGLMKIPFGTYHNLSIGPQNTLSEKREFIQNAYKTLNKAIYGHKEAKTHILQVLGKWMKNPDSGGNVLAIQGPMGNGKTTLVKEGISKVLDRPFSFIALGGASDSAYFDGHCYTYEGSHWGRIVQILQDSQCMNPVFYFDELDKISDTQKGEEIIHMLTHLTDSSQNSLFQDNYFPGIHLDLSKALFIFSYNDESRVNKILKDRMYVINTKGFSVDDKLKIAKEYLLPDIYKNYHFETNEIIFDDEVLRNIIQNYTSGEEGVRNFKRCLETIVSKINIYMLAYDPDDESSVSDLSFKITHFQMPFSVNRDHVDGLLSIGNQSKPPFHMYM
uniref:Uncharacterized protein n=1 Tax=viral metagenome TaxID=1070528 RepID=A0A6C0F5F1_9ZZZZ|tara:strand:+ start:10183 stop:12165 length:1983 start_codon:yes stop_codon:yes gene_type:complete